MADYELVEGLGIEIEKDDVNFQGKPHIKQGFRKIQTEHIFPGAFADGLSVDDDLCKKVLKYFFKWKVTATAKLLSADLAVDVADSGATQPSVNIILGSNASGTFSSDVSLSETEQAATINTSYNTLASGDRIQIVLKGTGTNVDAEDLHVRLVWEVTG